MRNQHSIRRSTELKVDHNDQAEGFKPHRYLDYPSIALRLDAMAPTIMRDGHDAIVIILRGVAFVGMHLSFATELPVYFLRYDRQTNQPSWVGQAPRHRKMLLCEDFAGSGGTLINSRQFLLDSGYVVATCVALVDRLSASTPDYACFWLQSETGRIILPWERYRLNHRVTTEPRMPDSAYKKVAFDMDGVFLDDIPSSVYANDFAGTLSLRDTYPLASYAPTISAGDCVVTGRPTMDYERTAKWLREHHIDIPLYLRDDGIEHPTATDTATWKANKAIELGCTHFVESDAEQAAVIASLYPALQVTWWNKGNPYLIQTAPTQQLA